MTVSRFVWLTPRDLRRDFGPVDALTKGASGATGRLHYRPYQSHRRTVVLALAAGGAGLAIAAPLLALGGQIWWTLAIAIGSVYTAALRLALVARARDRSLAHHGQILPRSANVDPALVRRGPQAAAMRLTRAFAAQPTIDDARDALAASALRALAPIAAGLWLAQGGTWLCAGTLLAAMGAGITLENFRRAAAFRADVSLGRFGDAAARFIAAWPVLRKMGATRATVERLQRRNPIAAARRAARAELRSSALFALGIPALAILVLLFAGTKSPTAMIGLAVAVVAAGHLGAVAGVQASRIAHARRRRGSADRLFGRATSGDRIERIVMLAVEDLSFQYPGAATPVFEHLGFCARSGEVLALTGPSGSGKTTLLRILTGIAQPSSGRVLVNGKEGADYRHRVAAVFQDEEIGAGTIRSAISGGAGISLDAAWDAAAQVGADDLIRSLPMEMQTLVVEGPFPPSLLQPLLIARAIAQSPDLVILDEALGALPRDRARSLLDSLRERGMLVILASHDPAIIALADRVVTFGEVGAA